MKNSFLLIGFLLISPCQLMLRLSESRPLPRDLSSIWTDIQDTFDTDFKAKDIPVIGGFLETPITSVSDFIARGFGAVTMVTLWTIGQAMKIAAKAGFSTAAAAGSLIFGKRTANEDYGFRPTRENLAADQNQLNIKGVASPEAERFSFQDEQIQNKTPEDRKEKEHHIEDETDGEISSEILRMKEMLQFLKDKVQHTKNTEVEQ